jgi:hypothetical protein
MNSQMHEKSGETGCSVTSIITSLHRPDQLYACLDMHNYRTGLYVFVLSIVLSTISVFLAYNPEIGLFINNPPSIVWQYWSPQLSIFILAYIPSVLKNMMFIFASSVILAFIIRYIFQKSARFSASFTIASISCAAYFLLGECVRWIALVLLAFNPSYDIQVSGHLYIIVILNSVLALAVISVFLWYMARGTVAIFGVPIRYAILISCVTFAIAQAVSFVVVYIVGGILWNS